MRTTRRNSIVCKGEELNRALALLKERSSSSLMRRRREWGLLRLLSLIELTDGGNIICELVSDLKELNCIIVDVNCNDTCFCSNLITGLMIQVNLLLGGILFSAL